MRLILTLLLCVASAPAACDYYVSNSGNDSNNGTSTGTPWQTIAKVNAATQTNKTFCFLAQSSTVAGVWREFLNITGSGSTFQSSGVGPQAQILGADIFSSWTAASGLYHTTYSTTPNQVLYNGIRLTQVLSQVAVVTGTWYQDTGNNFVWIFDSPTGATIELSQRNDAVEVNSGVGNVTLLNIEFSKGNIYGVYLNVCSTCTVTNVTSQWNYEDALHSSTGTGLTVTGGTFNYNGGSGIIFSTVGATIQHNSCLSNSMLINVSNTACVRSIGQTSGTVDIGYNSSFNGGPTNPAGSDGVGFWCDTVLSPAVCNIHHNRSDLDNEYGVFAENSNGAVWGNVITRTKHIAGGSGVGIKLTDDNSPPLSGFKAFNNSVYGAADIGIEINGKGTAGTCVNNLVQNNLIGGSTITLHAFGGCENDGTNGSGNVYDHNGFGVQATGFIKWGSTLFNTYAAWQADPGCASSACANAMTSDPLFTAPASQNLTLQAGSPALGAGTAVGAPYQFALSPFASFPAYVPLVDQSALSAYGLGAYQVVGGISTSGGISFSNMSIQ